MTYQFNQATSILATGSTEAFEKQQREQNPMVNTARKEGDYDLVSACRSVLVIGGVDITHYDGSRAVQDAANFSPEAQRHTLNRFFRNQMMTVPGSIEARTNLIDHGEFDDWIRLFSSAVVPFLAANSLPKNLF